ncbi:ABC transporter ATP-binding protein [Streptomyces clavuligerus]|uniref:Putative ABC transporter ATP-binding protein n=1 Tax=Streptomyces clavuligerus TaxID=1901 RepID=B5GQI2_STRCL|nr:ABC transporter ATP-binding protein [Streptomyces clavuligerus]ANW20321.1 ABC transporter ATP-binding protein [Streptomyces clavuligerus]AXU14947.1 ABC transporter ATP-binding protein [Streptomyces clavuligerus]EDY48578.1 ABC transporter ATP-binding protein [Streptomyces clavuligerus]EFG06737.1 Putative ABC transporter ATP-binding protein [Streptomyces clavuligerus]MBY6304994.1 ABC transporter ATP-binding protein [Streptomyces clavuligerus]
MTIRPGAGDGTSVDRLTVRYRKAHALDGISLSLGSGVTGLLGPNGAGKTTLMRVLATASIPSEGEVTVLGRDPRVPAQRQDIRRRLGYLPQTPGFHHHFTAFEFVDYVAILKEHTDRRGRHDEVRRVLEAVGLSQDRSKKIKALSGGMRQRVALAAALIGDPELLILDEPTVGLDPEQRLRFRELIADIAARRPVLLSTHQTEDVAALCHRVIVMGRGRVRHDSSPRELSEVARGAVWFSGERDPRALAGWRTGTGAFRNIGSPPPGAELAEPTLEDAYLLLNADLPAHTQEGSTP